MKKMIELLPLDVDVEPKFFERPDFLLETSLGLVALEHTESRDEHMAKGEGAYVLLKREIKRRLADASVTAGVVLSIADGALALLQMNIPVLKRNAELLAARAIEAAPSRQTVDLDEKALKEMGVEFIRQAWIYPNDDKQLVGINSGGMGRPASVLQRAIDAKAELLSDYRRRLAAAGYNDLPIWLLVVGSAGRGGSIDLEDASDQSYRSPFARTILLELWLPGCIDLSFQSA